MQKMSLIQPTFLFDDRQRFNAECDHNQLRSSLQSDFKTPPTADPWKQRPVDFTMKNFHPNRKKSRHPSSSSIGNIPPIEKQSQIPRIPKSAVMRPFAVSYQHTTKNDSVNNNDEKFLIDRRIKYDQVKRILNTEQYQNPKPHDFRQYPSIKELGLSEFHTAYDRDPYDIRFLSDHLNTLWLQEREQERMPVVEQPVPEMYRLLTARPNWDSRLILPKLVFPNKYAAYTRYRNPTRTVQSAYWERVDNGFEQRQKNRLNVI